MLKRFLNTHTILLSVILLLAAFLRLYRIGDYLTFLGDEGRDVLVVYNILHGHFTLLGPTASVGGFFLGPIYYYFMTPFLWLFHYNPVGPAVMVALFGIATVWLVYVIGKIFFNERAALIAAFLYAISPLIIAYSRSSWNPNLMPFFSLLCLYTLYKAVGKNSIVLYGISGIFLGIAMQLHYLTTFSGVIIVVYILVGLLSQKYFEKISWISTFLLGVRGYIGLSMGFLIGWSPFLLFEVRHGFQNIKSITDFVFHSKDTGTGVHFFDTISNVFFRLFGRLIAVYPPPEQVSLQGHTLITIWYIATLVLAISASVFLLSAMIKTIKNREKFLQMSLLFIWFVFGILLFGFYKKSIYDYYFAFLFPLPFLLVGGLFSFLYTKHIGAKIIVVVAVAFLAIINLQAMPFRYAPNRQLAQVEQIAKVVFDKSEGKPYNFALITGGNSDHAYRYFLTVWGHPPVTIDNVQVDPQRQSVTGQLLIVCESLPCHPLGSSLWEIAGFGRAEIVGHWNVSVVEVYKLGHYTGK